MTQQDHESLYSIGAVAKMIDVPTPTLRAWEDRYGVVKPERSHGSQRLYSRRQVEHLRFIKAQIDGGASAADGSPRPPDHDCRARQVRSRSCRLLPAHRGLRRMHGP